MEEFKRNFKIGDYQYANTKFGKKIKRLYKLGATLRDKRKLFDVEIAKKLDAKAFDDIDINIASFVVSEGYWDRDLIKSGMGYLLKDSYTEVFLNFDDEDEEE